VLPQGERIAVEPIFCPVPQAELIPCWREFDSLFRRAGNFISQVSKTIEFVDVFETTFRSEGHLLKIFPVDSLLGDAQK
jgi:hypothetical protein